MPRISRNAPALAALIAIAAGWPFPVAAATSARMNVSVEVVGRAVVTVDRAPDIEVTSDDLARGYVDVPAPIRVRVRSNSRHGYLLQAAKTSDVFAAVELAFGNSTMNVMTESWLARPYVAHGDVVDMRVRVRLASEGTPGRYRLPVEFSASSR